jgi:hypothetical protein
MSTLKDYIKALCDAGYDNEYIPSDPETGIAIKLDIPNDMHGRCLLAVSPSNQITLQIAVIRNEAVLYSTRIPDPTPSQLIKILREAELFIAATTDTTLERHSKVRTDTIHHQIDGQYMLHRTVDYTHRYLFQIDLDASNVSIKGFTECYTTDDALVLSGYGVAEAVRMYLNHHEMGFDAGFELIQVL